MPILMDHVNGSYRQGIIGPGHVDDAEFVGDLTRPPA
jgi:hypothetical protein